jgi:hypothetical protein
MDERSGVVDVSIRYALALDERDWELLAGVFTPDAEVYYSSGNHVQGRDAVVAQVRAALEGCGPTQHLLGNHVVEFDGDRARSRCYVRAFAAGAPDSRWAGHTYELFAVYRDELVRSADTWQVERRRMDVVFELGERRVLGTG